MTKIYGRLSSINVQKVIWCLDELGQKEGLDYERIDAGLHFGINKTEAYLTMNPNGLVPTLVQDDFILWESNAIMRYLAASHEKSAGDLFPADLRIRADADRWMDWSLVTLWPALRVTYLGLTRTPKEKQDIPLIIKHYQDSTHLLEIVDGVLAKQPYCAGATFTLGDITLALSVDRWVKLPAMFPDVLGELPKLDALMDWHRRVTGRAGFIKLQAS